MFLLIAQSIWQQPWGMSAWAIFVVVALVLLGIVAIVVKATGWTIPAWFYQILGLVALAIVAIAAIRFVSTL